ncbi:hypothetical protein [Streptomyces sp. 1331.2]|uniref:hypothetical protein n=1 Tax=Streptomyces sp. 1331.2 TaxID=1938835 RepID=UPI000BE46EC9|nr:hypothetical protein [Streptomyces sp. 1331.2]
MLGHRSAVGDALGGLVVQGSVFSDDLPLVAFNVPVSSDLAGIKSLLVHGVADGWWHFETACVTDDWINAQRPFLLGEVFISAPGDDRHTEVDRGTGPVSGQAVERGEHVAGGLGALADSQAAFGEFSVEAGRRWCSPR